MKDREEVLSNFRKGLQEDRVLGFFDEYRFLSNFHVCDCVWNGITFPSTEHAYQAAKSPKEYIMREFVELPTPNDAKKKGQKIALRKEWDFVKFDVMYTICHDKFNRHEELRKRLLETGDMYLEETNWWKDRYWGVYDGVGANNLGKILMNIRANFK
jgi:ribA/ribD-fused uncharacterized protein